MVPEELVDGELEDVEAGDVEAGDVTFPLSFAWLQPTTVADTARPASKT